MTQAIRNEFVLRICFRNIQPYSDVYDADIVGFRMLAESGFRIRRMTSKATWQSLAAAAGLTLVCDADLTAEALAFWTQGWKVAHVLLALLPWVLRFYIRRTQRPARTLFPWPQPPTPWPWGPRSTGS